MATEGKFLRSTYTNVVADQGFSIGQYDRLSFWFNTGSTAKNIYFASTQFFFLFDHLLPLRIMVQFAPDHDSVNDYPLSDFISSTPLNTWVQVPR